MRLRMLTGMRRVDVSGSEAGSNEGILARVRYCQRRDWRASWVVIQGICGVVDDLRRREFRSAFRVRRVWSEKWKIWLFTSEGVGVRAGDCGLRPIARRAGLYSRCVPIDWFGAREERGRRIWVSAWAFSARSMAVIGTISVMSRHKRPEMMVPMLAPSVTPWCKKMAMSRPPRMMLTVTSSIGAGSVSGRLSGHEETRSLGILLGGIANSQSSS